MSTRTSLPTLLRGFFEDYLTAQRDVSANTIHAYRDSIKLLLLFAARDTGRQVVRLRLGDLGADTVLAFLEHLETQRGNTASTRNARLAAIKSFMRFCEYREPALLEQIRRVHAIPFKRTSKASITYLEKSEIDALLAAPDRNTAQGRRDYALLLFLYNTGARANEAAQLTIGDLHLAHPPQSDHSFVRIYGKGSKQRLCPLWPHTASELTALIGARAHTEHVFLNRCSHPITRFGIHTLVERYVERVSAEMPGLATKQVSPHSIRHTCATHLLRSGVDINTIRAWLGHVSVDTTNVYAETDLEMKAKALACCEVKETNRTKRWRDDTDLMAFLRSL